MKHRARFFAAGALACALVAACTPPATDGVNTETMSAEEIDEASHEGPTGWLPSVDAAAPALSWRAGPNAVGFSLACTADALRVSAESVGTTAAPLADATPATLLIGAAPFTGSVSDDPGLLTMSMQIPLSPAVIAALKDADSARIVVGDAFVETGADGRTALAAFADVCAARGQP